MSFKPRFTTIKGLSERRGLPRLGKVRLGIKVKHKQSGNEYPKETDYFVCPEEVRAIYGEQPKELDIMLPINELDVIFPTAYKFYGQSRGLKCTGDGEVAFEIDEEGNSHQKECPCEKLENKKCKQRADLLVMLPKVSVGGVYQIGTSSYHSIVDINSSLDYVEALIGRFAMMPLKLKISRHFIFNKYVLIILVVLIFFVPKRVLD